MTKARTNADNVAGDISGVTAGTGLTGGGTSGTVTLTNDMATTINAAGDLIYGTGNDAYTRLALGTARQTLLTNAGATAPEWGASPQSLMTATGDILYASAANTPAKLAIGTAGHYLKVNSGATAPEWAAVAAGANWTLLNAGGTSLTGSATTISGISNADKIFILIYGSSSNSPFSLITLRLNSDSGTNYRYIGEEFYNSGGASIVSSQSGNSILIGRNVNDQLGQISGWATISGCNASGLKAFTAKGNSSMTDSNYRNIFTSGVYTGSSAITSISILSDTGTFDNGTVFVYTSA